MQHEHFTRSLGECPKRTIERGVEISRLGGDVRCVGPTVAFERVCVGVCGDDAPAAEHTNRAVSHRRIEIRLGGAEDDPFGTPLPDAEEHLLKHVIDEVATAQEAVGEAVQGVVVSIEESLKRRLVAGPNPRDQGRVDRRGVRSQ